MSEHAQGQAPQPTRSIRQFDALIGEWTMVGTHPLLQGELHGHSKFEWLREGALLVWHFEWDPGQKIPTGYSIIGHDDEDEPCTMLYTDERGVARIYQMMLEGRIWKQWRDSPDFAQRTTGTISADGNTITAQGELMEGGTPWKPDLSVIYTRKR